MTYIPVERVRRYLSTNDPDIMKKDDLLLEEDLDRAQGIIENLTGRTFEGYKDTHFFNADTGSANEHGYGVKDDGITLMLDEDLVKAFAVKNGDGTVIGANDYVYKPTNRKPKYAIVLKNDVWTYSSSPLNAISVRGWWGYCLGQNIPYDIQQACLRLTAYLYRQKDAQVFETTAFLEGGVLTVPQGFPIDVLKICLNRRRNAL
ncbi:MAG TPA: hypothetical protein VMW24_24775 [Sedimentisphaerales bacterium]|nr:hypothetical protein [Sedimentisphaerales bacterium]